MARRLVLYLIIALTGMSIAGSADARRQQRIDATPFSHAPCSVLSGVPCTPSFCSVFNSGPCIPEIDYPVGENLQLTIQSVPNGLAAGLLAGVSPLSSCLVSVWNGRRRFVTDSAVMAIHATRGHGHDCGARSCWLPRLRPALAMSPPFQPS